MNVGKRFLTTSLFCFFFSLTSFPTHALEGKWVKNAPLPLGRLEADSTILGSNIFYVGGLIDWNTTDQTDIYNIEEDRWSKGVPLPEKLHHVGLVGLGDYLFSFGGMDEKWNRVSSVYRFSFSTKTWKKMLPLGKKSTLWAGKEKTMC
jgi:N-acetylneuraminic acid mutarotase